MNNVLIMGSGRSGTSLVSGTLAKAGYFMGDELYPPRDSNPKGFFESPEINGINEAILSSIDYEDLSWIKRYYLRYCLTDFAPVGQHHGWVARVPIGAKMSVSPPVLARMKRATDRHPFCFKDPRFSYTLPLWRPFLQDCVFICVFREPFATARSIVKECGDVDHLNNERMNLQIAIEVWMLMYQHILRIHRQQGNWLFIHFDQVLTGQGLDKIEYVTGASVDRAFPEASLKRSPATGKMSRRVAHIYEELCELAGHP